MAKFLKKIIFPAIVSFVLLIAAILRFWQLPNYPPSLSIDEVAIGYNAYSILKTAKDEWGEFLPLAFKSIGDYKPPVDIYLTVPSIAVLGLNELAVRFPVALVSFLTVIIFMLLLSELSFSKYIAILGGFWLAILAWHIDFSRSSFEAVTALFFLILGLWLYLKWLNKQLFLSLVGSILFFSLSVWSYHSERFFVPLLILFLLIYHWSVFKKLTQTQRIIILIVIAIFVLPFIKLAVLTPAISTRALSTSILSEPSLGRSLHQGDYHSFFQLIFDNDWYLIFHHWLGKYLNYFDLRFWFWDALELTPAGFLNIGLLYAVDLPIILFGFFALIKSPNSFLKKLSLFWFFAGPLAASFTMNEQHPLRAMVWIPFFGIVYCFGINFLFSSYKTLSKILFSFYLVLLLLSVINFTNIYLIDYPFFYSEYRDYGYKQISEYVCQNHHQYQKVIVGGGFGSDGPLVIGIPYAYYLFYCQFDPAKFQTSPNRSIITNIEFRRPDYKTDLSKNNYLLIGSVWDFLAPLPQSKIIKKLYFLNGSPAFEFVDTSK